jgi:hypothetical protein
MTTRSYVTEFCSYTERRRDGCAPGVIRESHGNCAVYAHVTAEISGCKYRNSKAESHSRVQYGSVSSVQGYLISSVQGYLNLIGYGCRAESQSKGRLCWGHVI